MRNIPVVVANQRHAIRIARREAELPLHSFDRHEAFTTPPSHKSTGTAAKDAALRAPSSTRYAGPIRQADDVLAVAGAVEHRLEILAHGAEYLGAHVERVVHRSARPAPGIIGSLRTSPQRPAAGSGCRPSRAPGNFSPSRPSHTGVRRPPAARDRRSSWGEVSARTGLRARIRGTVLPR